MKVVVVVPVLIIGGAETMVTRLVTAIDRSTVDIEVISMYSRQGTTLESKIEDAGIPIHYIGKQKKASLRAVKELFLLLSEINPDVVHCHIYSTFYALLWVVLRNKPLIHTVHTLPNEEFPWVLSKILHIMVYLQKLTIVAVSNQNYSIAKRFYGDDEKRVTYINNPVETSNYYRQENRNDKNVVFINVGRQDVNKNQMLAMCAMKRVVKEVPNARMILVGDGNQHETLIAERNRLGLESIIDLPGAIANPEHILAKSDVYVSTSHMEGLPLSILEAMAAGLPIIATNVGGVPDIVHDNGVLIPVDEDSLVKEMIRFAKDPELAASCGKKSKDLVKEYDVKKCAEAYENLYYEVVKKE